MHSTSAVVLPIVFEDQYQIVCIGLNPHLPYDEAYSTFTLLVARQHLIYNSISNELRTSRAREQAGKEHLSRIAESSPCGILSLSAAGKILFANAVWHELTGAPASESLDVWPTFVAPEHRDRILAAFDQAIATQQPHIELEYQCVLPCSSS